MIKPKILKPYQGFCMTLGELPTSYMESMTYYEMLEWFCKYFQDTLIPKINELITTYNETMETLEAEIINISKETITELIEEGLIDIELDQIYNPEDESLTLYIRTGLNE